MLVREATEQDIPGMVRLNGEVQELHVAMHPQVFKKTNFAALEASFEGQLRAENIRCLVAADGIEVIGYAVLRVVEKPENDYCYARRYAYVDQICVAATTRRKGVATALFEALRELARKDEIGRIELDVWTFNSIAKETFRSLGFETLREVMAMKID